MPTNEETLKAALTVARNFVQAQSGGEWDEEIIERDAQELSVAIAAFAESEVSRAVQECIEAQCVICRADSSDIPERQVCHGIADWFHEGEIIPCSASDIREHFYQRELASKGEESRDDA